MKTPKTTTKKITKLIYLFSHGITYKNFYRIWKRFPNGTIVPQMMISGKAVWQMIRDKQLFVYIDPKQQDDPVRLRTAFPWQPSTSRVSPST